MAKANNRPWSLNAFLDSLVLELDRARETLAIKGVNNPMTYAVKDVALELQLFPEFDGDELRFSNARPGDAGASKMSIQLGAISDRQIRETTKPPVAEDDIAIENVPDIDHQTKRELRKIGVSSVKDVERLEKRQVKLENADIGLKTDFKQLVDRLKSIRSDRVEELKEAHKKSLRRQLRPDIRRVDVKKEKGKQAVNLNIEGANLAVEPTFRPRARFNNRVVAVTHSTPSAIQLSLHPDDLADSNQVEIVLDPFAIVKFNLNNTGHET